MYLGTIDNTPRYRKYLWIFFLLAFGFCAFIFDYALSRVTVRIYPQNVKQTTKTTLSLDQTVTAPNGEKLVFPAKVVEKEAALEMDIATTGIKKDEGFAQGMITVESKRDKEISLPKGFKLIYGSTPVANQPWRDKIIFALDNDLVIPAGGTVTAPVTAVNKGERGNIAAGPFYFASMATWNRERLLPKADTAFSGGVIETKIISQEDIDRAKEELIQKVKKKSLVDLVNQLASDKMTNEDLSYFFVDEFAVDKPVGEMTEKFPARIKGRFKALLLPKEEIRQTLEKKISKEYSNSELVKIDENSFTLAVKSLDVEKGQAELEATLSGTFAPKFSAEVFEKNGLAGFNENAIKQKYSTNPAIAKVEAKFFPFWRKTVPSLADHVFVEIVK